MGESESIVAGAGVIGFEGTNDFWRWLANYTHEQHRKYHFTPVQNDTSWRSSVYLEEEGQPYRLVNAFAVKQQRVATQLDYAKDAWRDAGVISHLLRNGQFTETQLLQGQAREMREMERAH